MTTSPGEPMSFSRPFRLHRLARGAVDDVVEANGAERLALASELGLGSIDMLRGEFRIAPSGRSVRVEGRVKARVEQICVVSLDPFEVEVDEPVELAFAPPGEGARTAEGEIELDPDRDTPDELVGDVIDLGAITVEFLVLALDPYPRKPGVAFEQPQDPGHDPSPFARLASIRTDREPS